MPRLPIPLMIAMALTLWSLLAAFTALRLLSRSTLAGRPRTAARACLALLWLGPPLAMAAGALRPAWTAWTWAAVWSGYALMGVIAIVFPYTLARDLLWGLAWALRLVPAPGPRRTAWFNATSAAVVVLTLASAAAGLVGGALPPRVVTVALPVRDLPAPFEGFTIAFFSDLHLGAVTSRRLVRQIVDRVNAAHPDVAVLGGDIADGTAAALGAEAAGLAEIRAPSGRFFVTGNHDYFRDPVGWLAEVRRLGYTTLTNGHVVVRRGAAGVVIAGIPDYLVSVAFGTPSDPAAALRGAPPAAVRILLSHNPVAAPEAAAAGFDYQLSGHAHGGQFFPWTLVFGNLPWYHTGFHDAGRMRLYVSAGAGSWGPPMRLGSRKDVTIFRLVRTAPGVR
ncbi:MAG: metallophosphoesterase [Candidatus Coatesbacteria bacterium]